MARQPGKRQGAWGVSAPGRYDDPPAVARSISGWSTSALLREMFSCVVPARPRGDQRLLGLPLLIKQR